MASCNNKSGMRCAHVSDCRLSTCLPSISFESLSSCASSYRLLCMILVLQTNKNLINNSAACEYEKVTHEGGDLIAAGRPIVFAIFAAQHQPQCLLVCACGIIATPPAAACGLSAAALGLHHLSSALVVFLAI